MATQSSAVTVEAALVRALEHAWEGGSPVAGSTPDVRESIATVAVRRIRSFSRRGVAQNDAARAGDLARGLVAKFERNPGLVGPLIRDYRRLADTLLRAYADVA